MQLPPRLDDPAWLDTQYDNRARVPAALSHLARWSADSKRVRETSPHAALDLHYGDEPGETLDLFPAEQRGAPVLLYVHGGYWRSLHKSDFSFVAPPFVAAGATVVVPDYALCPTVTIEQIALQMVRAVAWTWRHVAEYGGDPSRIALVGHSAGGHLAAMLLSCRWKQVADDLPPMPFNGALAISGLYDLEPVRRTPFLQKDLNLTPQQVARLSPAFFPRPKAGRLFATVGAQESDEFLRHNQLIRDQWGPTAVPVCEAIPDADHFTVLDDLVAPKGRLHGLARQLLGLT
jgi:arylformamidase